MALCGFTIMRTVWCLLHKFLGKHLCIFFYFQANSPECVKENQAPSYTDIQHCITSTSSSVYPCTSTVNPTIVLLQHNRGEHTSLWVRDDGYQEEFPKSLRFIRKHAFTCRFDILSTVSCLWSISLVLLTFTSLLCHTSCPCPSFSHNRAAKASFSFRRYALGSWWCLKDICHLFFMS